MQLTYQQMLAHWRRSQGLDSLDGTCVLEVVEGLDLTTALSVEMRGWYLNLLDKAPIRYLDPEEVSSRLTPERVTEGVWRVAPRGNIRRILEVTVAGAIAPVRVTTAPEEVGTQRDVALSANRYARLRRCRPIVVPYGRTVWIYYDSDEAPVLESVLAVCDTGDEEYRFDESALTLLPDGPTDLIRKFLTI